MDYGKTRVCVDVYGGDKGPQVVLDGVERALAEDPELEVVLTGRDETVTPFASSHDRVEAVATTEVIEMGEHPANAVRKKKDSSIVVGCRLVREGRAQGFFSAGSTGACMSAATLVMGRIPGIKRPALVSVIPALKQQVLLSDCGANADCKPEYLVQFAQMNAIYAHAVLGRQKVRVGLLNIGSEDTKGSAAAQEAFTLLREQVPEFVGNCEGNDIMTGEFDVVVADGFTGNVALKTLEGTAKSVFKLLKGAMTSSLKNKIGALLLKGSIKELAGTMSSDAVGGAPLLGLKGICIIGHGSSGPVAVANGIHATSAAIHADVVGLIASAVSEQQ